MLVSVFWSTDNIQVKTLKRKLKKRNEEADILRKEGGLMTQSANKSPEEKVTESIAEMQIPRKMSRKLSNADKAVIEAEMERKSLTAEINGLKQRLNKVMGQTRA